MKDKTSKVYNPTNISALARYLGTSTQTIHNWKRDDGDSNTKRKFDLIMIGWQQLCKEKRDEQT